MLSDFEHAVGFGAPEPVEPAPPDPPEPPESPEDDPGSLPSPGEEPEPELEPDSDEAPVVELEFELTRMTFVPISAPTTAPAVTNSTRMTAIQIPDPR